jgi:hypothetical protein
MGRELTHFAVPDASWKAAEGNMPKQGMVVKYRTDLYQMLGYVDVTGRWVATDGAEERLPVKSWREIFDIETRWPERLA